MNRIIPCFIVAFSLSLLTSAPAQSEEVADSISIASICARGQSLQEPFLNTLRKEKVPVSIFLVNGIKLQGQIESFDQFVVLLRNSVSQMVYKHAISTIVPAHDIELTYEDSTITDGSDPLY